MGNRQQKEGERWRVPDCSLVLRLLPVQNYSTPLLWGGGRLLLNLNPLDPLPAAHAGALEERTKRSCFSARQSSHTISHAESHTLDCAYFCSVERVLVGSVGWERRWRSSEMGVTDGSRKKESGHHSAEESTPLVCVADQDGILFAS